MGLNSRGHRRYPYSVLKKWRMKNVKMRWVIQWVICSDESSRNSLHASRCYVGRELSIFNHIRTWCIRWVNNFPIDERTHGGIFSVRKYYRVPSFKNWAPREKNTTAGTHTNWKLRRIENLYKTISKKKMKNLIGVAFNI